MKGIRALAVVLAVALSAQVALAQDEGMNQTQTRMRGVFITLTKAYKYSLDPAAFEDLANRDDIESALQALAANARELKTHGGGLDASFDYLRRSLSRDATDALDRFENRQYVGSRFLLTKLTENCVTCHSKLPDHSHFDMGAKFLEEAGVEKLAPLQRVDLEIATRQFDRALDTYEGAFADKHQDPQTLALVGSFAEYIRLCVGVVEDPQRAVKTLTAFEKRDDLSGNMKDNVQHWVADLKTLDLAGAKGHELETAREMIDKTRAAKRFPEDRRGLVEFIGASALLHRYLHAGVTNPDDKADALYLLAVAEANISRSYWVSETPSLLGQAIVTAPKSNVAKLAYAFLEQYTLSGQSVTARTVPENVTHTLDSLRTVMEK